ncbi:hypothetical protein F6X39_32960 [Paraburkholderia sp. UCT2]|nr:hypothetical protein [Paraburkholderia sp. UCT2]
MPGRFAHAAAPAILSAPRRNIWQMFDLHPGPVHLFRQSSKEALINGPTAQVADEMPSNFPDDEANRCSTR